MLEKKKSFTITCPPGSVIITIALGIVYNWHVALVTLVLFFVLGTIIENFLV